MESSITGIPIEEKQLEQFNDKANRLLSSVKWTPKNKDAGPSGKSSAPAWRDSSVSEARSEELSVLKSAHLICRNPVLLSDDINHALNTLCQGLRIGMHLSKTYTKFSGLDQLIALNSRGGLAEAQKAEFRNKYISASAITVYSVAYYTVWELSRHKTEEVSSVNLEFAGIPELSLRDPVRALDCVIHYYAAYLAKSGSVRSNLEFLKLTLLYFQAVVEEIQLRKESFQHTDSFTSQSYKLAGSDFCINGFDADLDSGQISIEFNRVELDQIVGNRDAKHEARRLASRLLCYDMTTKLNPMVELGGLAPISMGYGEPGTGKSMLIAALATMLDDYCRQLQIPFLFWPMPDTVVSTFQGGSAERMMNWMRALKDPGKIVYAPIDDAENNLEERTRQGVSAGVREVIAVFLRNTEGAYAVQRGNNLIQLFTNLPDQIDKAVMSRINNRFYIGGAVSREDFLDQDHLWLQRYNQLDPHFVGMKDPGDYSYLSSQTLLKSMSQVYQERSEPREDRVKEVFERVQRKHDAAEHTFYAELFSETKKAFPFFTSRDLRNIQRAIDSRVMDFDFPEDWFENPEIFFGKSYQDKKSMIEELMRVNMKGLSFTEIRLQESIRYLDNMVDIAESGRERRIQEMVESYQLQREAKLRLS